jgi:phosphopantothenoylcysteine decarboxylase / phosphopantothenate---cysteine ligase
MASSDPNRRPMMLEKKIIALGVTGSIASYKALYLLRLYKEAGVDVWPMLSASATRFVRPLSFSSLSGHKAVTDLWSDAENGSIGHVEISHRIDLLVIAPATAHTLQRLATGAADDALSACALSTKAPKLIAPAMEDGMWNNPATQKNVQTLRDFGWVVVGPSSGALASGREGDGRMSEPEEIFEASIKALTPQTLAGQTVLVTAGPTREALDPARFISNRSSGKMGFAIAQMAQRRGATVHLVSGPTSLPVPYGVVVSRVETTEDLLRECTAQARAASVVIMAGAPADFRPKTALLHKLKKLGTQNLEVAFESTPDVLKTLSETVTHAPVIVGFAAETQDVLANAQEKLKRKNADMIVANDISSAAAGFEVDTNEVILVFRHQPPLALPTMSKDAVAMRILDHVEELLRAK